MSVTNCSWNNFFIVFYLYSRNFHTNSLVVLWKMKRLMQKFWCFNDQKVGHTAYNYSGNTKITAYLEKIDKYRNCQKQDEFFSIIKNR